MSLSHPLSNTSPCTWCQGSLSFLNSSNYQAFLSACCSKSLGHNFRGLVYFSHRYLSESISDKVQWAVAQRKYQQLKVVSNMGMGHWKREGRRVGASCSQEQWTNCSWGSSLLMKLYPYMTRAWSDQNGYWMIWTSHGRFPSSGQIWEGLFIYADIPVLQASYFPKVN